MKKKLWPPVMLLAMRITGFLMLVCLVELHATGYSQEVKLTLKLNGVRLDKLFDIIQQNSDYKFLYNDDDIRDSLVSVDVKKATVPEILALCLKGRQLRYNIVDKTIIIAHNNSLPARLTTPPPLTVTGTVTDAKGAPLPGVSIVVKGQQTGAVSDGAGHYRINVPDNAALVFSFVGYISQELAVNGRATLNVQLQEDLTKLGEVVVTALGIQKEARQLGYAATTVKGADVAVNRTPNIGNSLQGKVAGLNVSSVNTGAGGSSKIRIRGASSFKGNNSPLIILNGVPMNNNSYGARKNDAEGNTSRAESYTDGGDGLLSINPDDIESINILKGATAAALYGFRAKDGAIVITTRSGKRNQGIGVEVNSNFVVDRAIDQTDFQYEYGQGEQGLRPQNIADAGNTGTWSFGEKIDGKPTIQFDGQVKPYSAVKNRINKFYRTGYTWSNTVSFSGGNDKGSFNLSMSDMNNESIMPNSGYRRQAVNLGLNYAVTSKLQVNVFANYSHEKSQNPPNVFVQQYNANTTVYSLANTMDLTDLKEHRRDENGNERNISRFTPRTNPYWIAYERFENIVRDRLMGNISLRYDLLPWLYIQGRAGQDYFTRSQDYNVPTGTRFLGPVTTGFNGQYYQEVVKFRERNYDFLIGANRKFGNIDIDLTLGGNQMVQINENNNVVVNNFFIRDLYTVQNGQIKDPQYLYSEKRVNSLYGAAELSWKNYLFLNLTARNDWFSTLNPNSNNYLYPSISTSFVFTDAFKLPSWFNFGKFRIAYAQVGGDTDPYQNNLYYVLNPNPHLGLALGGISGTLSPNPDLRPLKVKEFETGMEGRLFDDRIGFDVAWYRKNTIDEILSVQISGATGYAATLVNVGRLRNQGIEWLLTGVPVNTSAFRWEVNINGAHNTSKVLELAAGQPSIIVGTGEYTGRLAHEVGKPMASLQGTAYLRAPDGQIIFKNGRPANADAVKTFGSAIPTWTGGVINTFTIKGVRVSVLVDGKFGNKLISNTNFNLWRHGLHKATLEGREQGFVVGKGVMEDPNAPGKYIPNNVPVPVQTYYESVRSNNNIAEEFVYDASFIKLRQITIGYDLAKLLGSRSPFKGLAVSLVANNVAVLSKHTPNIDPEMVTAASDNLQGLESGGLPMTRSMGINVHVKF
ncbi:SusC/RagA family TonB-linked outer membrane protein [Chitinophaga agrisoli]|uniref:SusC/RagA family TonB-linked outer membrane protein n=1 Tax=Chitinophaga agrisoli TaxID=2607653 RepID=A0A5B2VSM9_9BACT|nr:SusC/RagA family TonB-linked outer membrane protein [Chitinophaga agrisoli]KAA2241282.1 SusC/RagA family TonB-linked outer membrane protein [Chitinophaga agrisoli]